MLLFAFKFVFNFIPDFFVNYRDDVENKLFNEVAGLNETNSRLMEALTTVSTLCALYKFKRVHSVHG